MKKIEIVKRSTAFLLCIPMIFSIEMGAAAKTPDGYAAPVQKESRYLVGVHNRQHAKQLETVYGSDADISGLAEDNLEKNNMAAVTLTDSEAETLEENPDIAFVEEDIEVKACGKSGKNQSVKQIHKKIENRLPKNKGKSQWNMRMIHGDKVTQDKFSHLFKRKGKTEKKKIKVAVLDSGVDYWSDIDLAESLTLVPDEEEMSLLFMDGTGHGNSVAGLIAAKDNEEGITGVNPNAEIYSIRVLDNDNCSLVSRIVEGIYMAIERDVDIINMSFGVSTYSAALEQAVKDAEQAGILMVAAAGNVGDKGVQYPAAFDEVIAVGSVDKDGNLASDSSTGEQVELVAPGELVMSTGDFGDVRVASGTSLAAPQVAGAASLLWEKDPDMPAAFIRQILIESANCYGEHNKYGGGLLDVEYAWKNYNTLKKQYKKSNDVDTMEIPENREKIVTFDETDCVEGNWSLSKYSKNHESMIPSKFSNVKKGARFPDEKTNKDGKDTRGTQLYVFQGMEHNPWWHGYFRLMYAGKGKKLSNYVTAYVYETRLANQMQTKTTAAIPRGMQTDIANEIKNDISKINWSKQFGSSITNGKKRAFVWGMALHSLSDVFAHSTTDGLGERITHDNNRADNPSYYSLRWDCAVEAVTLALNNYSSSIYQSGTYNEFSPVKKQAQFMLINIYEYIKETGGVSVANTYKTKSVSKRVTDNK